MTSKVTKIQLPGSGAELAIRAVTTATVLLELQRQFPQPTPPTNRVNYGTDERPDWRIETNYSDPDYIGRILPAYQLMLDSKFANIILKRALVKRPLTDAEKAEVADVRSDYEEEGIEVKGSDYSIWVRHVACGGDGDLNYLVEQVRILGDPTAGVAAEADSFRSDI